MLDIQLSISILIIAIIFSFVISFPIISILYKFSLTRRGDVDFSNLIEERKKKIGTPIMGGLIMVISFIVLNLIFNADSIQYISMPLLIFSISALLGGIDDILNIYGKPRKVLKLRRTLKLIKVHKNYIKRFIYLILLPWIIYKRIFYIIGSNPGKGVQAHEKILVQVISGLLLALWLILYPVGGNPFALWIPIIGNIDIWYFFVPFVIFVLVSTSNAVNLSDGMDGLAAGLLMTSLLGFLVIAIHTLNIPIIIMILVLLGGLISYLYFNIPPARFQMGDVGSLSMGTILTIIAFALNVPILLVVIGFPFVAEVASSLIQSLSRRLFGKRILDMAPLHHHFEMKGWNEEKVVMRFWLFGIVCSIVGLWIYFYL
jgi:phospho-N-acetylmuramoyl-pentapeptide-transferase